MLDIFLDKNSKTVNRRVLQSPMTSEKGEQVIQEEEKDSLFVARKSLKILTDSVGLLKQHVLGLDPQGYLRIVKLLNNALFTKNTIHLMGMGRSRLVAELFAEFLLDENLSSSVIGSTYAKPVRHGDVVIGISGSGETRSTVDNVRATTFREVFIVGITARGRSQLARFSDQSVVFEWAASERVQSNYIVNQLTGRKSPLTPMGTLFEFATLIYAITATKGLYDPENPKHIFKEISRYTIEVMNQVRKGLKPGGYLFEPAMRFLEILEKDLKYDNQVFWLGSELSEYIATMSGMRARHAGVRIRARTSWRFKKTYDHFLLIAFDTNKDPTARWLAKEAKDNKLRTNVLTTNYKNPLENIDDQMVMDLKIKEPKNQFIRDEAPYHRRLDDMIFQFVAANFLDSLIAQLAYDMGIQEKEMKEKHANVE